MFEISGLQVLAKIRAQLTFEVFESVEATESDVANPLRDSFVATGELAETVQPERAAVDWSSAVASLLLTLI